MEGARVQALPGKGTRSHREQLRLKILNAATKTQCSQISIKRKKEGGQKELKDREAKFETINRNFQVKRALQ